MEEGKGREEVGREREENCPRLQIKDALRSKRKQGLRVGVGGFSRLHPSDKELDLEMASSSSRQTPAGSPLPPEQAVALATGPWRSQGQPQVKEACLKPGHETAIGNTQVVYTLPGWMCC